MGSTRPRVGAASLLLAAIAVLLIGCGGGGSGADSTSPSASTASGSVSGQGADAVTIVDYTFKPATITVPTGTTVEFSNEDSTAHTATSKQSGAFDTDAIEPGKGGSVTLEKAGSFSYYCVFHPFMKGTIVVE